jgi:hypothetical protein
VRDHPREAQRTWTQAGDKWDKLKQQDHKEKKLHNVMGDNAGSQWKCFNMIDDVLSNISKIDKVHDGMDNGHDVGMEEQPPSQQEEATQ